MPGFHGRRFGGFSEGASSTIAKRSAEKAACAAFKADAEVNEVRAGLLPSMDQIRRFFMLTTAQRMELSKLGFDPGTVQTDITKSIYNGFRKFGGRTSFWDGNPTEQDELSQVTTREEALDDFYPIQDTRCLCVCGQDSKVDLQDEGAVQAKHEFPHDEQAHNPVLDAKSDAAQELRRGLRHLTEEEQRKLLREPAVLLKEIGMKAFTAYDPKISDARKIVHTFFSRYRQTEAADHYFETHTIREGRSWRFTSTLVTPSFYPSRFLGNQMSLRPMAEDSACETFIRDARAREVASKLPPPTRNIKRYVASMFNNEWKQDMIRRGVNPKLRHTCDFFKICWYSTSQETAKIITFARVPSSA